MTNKTQGLIFSGDKMTMALRVVYVMECETPRDHSGYEDFVVVIPEGQGMEFTWGIR